MNDVVTGAPPGGEQPVLHAATGSPEPTASQARQGWAAHSTEQIASGNTHEPDATGGDSMATSDMDSARQHAHI